MRSCIDRYVGTRKPSPPLQVAWEAARQEQLAVLKQSLAMSLAMVGDGQKQAVNSILAARETAARHGKAWQQIAEASVRRHNDARVSAIELKAAQPPAVALEAGVFRREVQRAAMRHTRRVAAHDARDRSQSGRGVASTTPAPQPLSSRMSPFYGPVAAEGRHVTVAEKVVVIQSLRRTQQARGGRPVPEIAFPTPHTALWIPSLPSPSSQVGTPTSTSVVRAPVVVERPTPAGTCAPILTAPRACLTPP